MPIQPNTQIQELGKDLLTARRFFRRFGIDINAHPGMTLSDVCAQAGISHSDFLHSLKIMNPERKAQVSLDAWAEAPAEDLVHHIVDRHHAYARRELERLRLLIDDVSEESESPEIQRIREPFQRLYRDLLEHLRMEEEHLFPSFLGKGTPRVLRTLEDLHDSAVAEHSAVEALIQDIAVLTRNFRIPEGASLSLRSLYRGLRDLEEDLVLHLYLENHLLFPMAINGR